MNIRKACEKSDERCLWQHVVLLLFLLVLLLLFFVVDVDVSVVGCGVKG